MQLEELVLDTVELRESPEEVIAEFKKKYHILYEREDFKSVLDYIESVYLNAYIEWFKSGSNSAMEQLKEKFDKKIQSEHTPESE